MNKLIIICFMATVLLASCGSSSDSDKAEVETETNEAEPANDSVAKLTPIQLKNADLEIGTAEKRPMHRVLKVNGVIDVPPQNIISVSFPVGGFLKKMTLLPGMPIRRGQVLAVLEDQQFIQLQQDYLTVKNRLSYLSADFERQKTLNETKAASDKVFQQAKAAYDNEKVLVRALAEKLRLININPDKLNENTISRSVNIYSTINGYVSKVNVNPGKYVSPTDVLFDLLDPSDIHLGLTVFEQDVKYLYEGQEVICYTNNEPENKHIAHIILINRNIDEHRASEVHCHFKDYDPKLLPGMFMNAEIEVENDTALALPEGAVVRWQGGHYIFAAEGDYQFKMMPIHAGNTANGYTEVKSNNLPEKLVVKNAYTLLTMLKNSSEEDE